MNLIKVEVNTAEYGLQVNKAQEIVNVYKPMTDRLEIMNKEYVDIIDKEITPELSKKARELRLKIAKVRTDSDTARKVAKEESLKTGNAIQGIYNKIKKAAENGEEKLLSIEKHQENLEKERILKIENERKEVLKKYELEVFPNDLGTMTPEIWENFLTGTRVNYEAKKEAEKKAEEERKQQEEKKETFQKRVLETAQYAYIEKNIPLTIDTTAEEYNKLLMDLKQKEEAHKKEQQRIKTENEKLKKEAAEKERMEKEKEAQKQAKINSFKKSSVSMDDDLRTVITDYLDETLCEVCREASEDIAEKLYVYLKDRGYGFTKDGQEIC